MNCNHEQFYTHVVVSRLCEDGKPDVITGYHADIKIHCTQCGNPFEFLGVPGGFSPTFPTASIDGTELRQPIRPSNLPVVKNPNVTYN
jgi:hypothetical protein